MRITTMMSAVAILVPTHALAQPWIGEQHDLSLSLGYELNYASTMREGDLRVTGTPTTRHTWTMGVDYVPIDRLELRLSLPATAAKYTGPQTGNDHP